MSLDISFTMTLWVKKILRCELRCPKAALQGCIGLVKTTISRNIVGSTHFCGRLLLPQLDLEFYNMAYLMAFVVNVVRFQ
jgi:hypothetical protein